MIQRTERLDVTHDMMKKIILTITLCLSAILPFAAKAQEQSTYFPYPQVPDDIVVLSSRCNYLVDKFWDRCNLKQSFSALDKLEGAFIDWVSFMPYATTDTVFPAIDRFLANVAKVGPEEHLAIAKMAERRIYSDSAEVFSEELYLPFCASVAANKKVNKAEKEHFAAQARVIGSSGLGKTVPAFDFTGADGSKKNFADVIASRVILLFLDPNSMDCNLAKVRISADYNTNRLIENNLVKVVALYPTAVTDEIKAEMEACPDNWIVGSMPDAALDFDLSGTPPIYYLDARHKVLGKNLGVEQLLVGVRAINQSMNQ